MPYKDSARERERQLRRRPWKSAYMRTYYSEHREERLAYDRERRTERRSELNARRRLQYAARREQILTEQREARLREPERFRRVRTASYARNAERRREDARQDRAERGTWQKRNPERARILQARYHARHREELNRRHREHIRRNRAYYTAAQAKRRVRKLGNGGSHTLQEWQDKIALFGGCCAYCGRSDRPLCRDHKTPITRGGSDFITNIVPACRPCNAAKHTKTAREYLGLPDGTEVVAA